MLMHCIYLKTMLMHRKEGTEKRLNRVASDRWAAGDSSLVTRSICQVRILKSTYA